MKIGMAQINPSTGDLRGNAEKIRRAIRLARKESCDLVVIPETAITGYMSCDLLEIRDYVESNRVLLREAVLPECQNIVAVVGFVDDGDAAGSGGKLHNAAAVIQNGRIVSVAHKQNLCRYRYYDETRYFAPGKGTTVTDLKLAGRQRRVGVLICEDLWDDDYPVSPYRDAVEAGAEMIVVINASPFETHKWEKRVELVRRHQAIRRIPVVYTNTIAIGDNLKDIILFDGRSMIMDASGRMSACGPLFREKLSIVELDSDLRCKRPVVSEWTEEEELYSALTFGLREYCRQTGFDSVLLGVSGGVDSALCAALAADAVGKDRVLGVSLPSKFSSSATRESAEMVCRNTGIGYMEMPITDLHQLALKVIGRQRMIQHGVTEENVQARLRGLLLMALSNETGRMVIATGNKTELGLGYCTLYGDMAGGLLLIGDVNKMQVYCLARYLNRRAGREVIPEEVLRREPSAELAEGQVDPFDYAVVAPILDDIIARISPRDIMDKYRNRTLDNRFPGDVYDVYDEEGFRKVVADTYRSYRVSAFKRAQSSPTVIVSSRALGFDLRETIINNWEPNW
jgi:NAD+ synthase (glutamine-hydrolysing)